MVWGQTFLICSLRRRGRSKWNQRAVEVRKGVALSVVAVSGTDVRRCVKTWGRSGVGAIPERGGRLLMLVVLVYATR